MNLETIISESGVAFGTSGARGLVSALTDKVAYAYSTAFLTYLKNNGQTFNAVAVAGDLRSSTGRIMAAVGKSIADQGATVVNCGRIPSPALAGYGIKRSIPTIMITGSHIPDDRNGIKYNSCYGEILKSDEAGIKSQELTLADIFDERGQLREAFRMPDVDQTAGDEYLRRYQDCFPADLLKGKTIGLYEHSAVGRDLIGDLLKSLGAELISLGRSEVFVPVDTEAIRPEDCQLAAGWATEFELDSIVSTDGDSDRPLVSDENGKWLRGDIVGILTAQYLKADSVATPVSCNTAVDKCGSFKEVIRTRIGSPYVIAAMQTVDEGNTVVGYEANGGFLTGTDFSCHGNTLSKLTTRDAVLPMLAILSSSIEQSKTISELQDALPSRYTASNRLEAFPTVLSQQILHSFNNGDLVADIVAIDIAFSSIAQDVTAIDYTDGVRIEYDNDDIIHLRPSGNAPELRCYTESDTEEAALALNNACIEIMSAWRK